MAVALFFDVHVDHAIVGQLRLREVDVLTAQEDGTDQLSDDSLLEHATWMITSASIGRSSTRLRPTMCRRCGRTLERCWHR